MTSTPKWRGYLTIGSLTREAVDRGLASCFENNSLPPLEVEPGRIFVLAGYGRKTLEVWSESRTRVRLDADCVPIEYASVAQYIQLATLSADAVRFAGGHQTLVSQSFNGEGLVFQSDVGGGELGPPATELPFPGEVAPPDRDFLDGGLRCNAVVRTVNGAAGPNLRITGGLGVLVEDHANLSRVVVDINGESLSVCPSLPVADAVDCVSDRSAYCGNADGSPSNCPPGPPDQRGGYDGATTTQPPPAAASGGETAYFEPGGVRLPGSCRFRRALNEWRLLRSDLSTNYECHTPNFAGYEGQEVVMPGQPIAADPTTIVRNAYFLADRQWWATTNTVVHAAGGPLAGLPYALVAADSYLDQAAIPVAAGTYSLQFALSGQGPVEIRLSRSGQVVWTTQATFEPADIDFVSPGFLLSSGNYDLSIRPITHALAITQVALVRQ